MKITLLTGRIFDLQRAAGPDVKISISPRAKRLTLRIDAGCRQAVLTLPPHCSQRSVLDFVERHRDWIDNNLRNLPESATFRNGEIISILGCEYQICHCPQSRGIRLHEGRLEVSGQEEFLHRRVKDFLKKLAAEQFQILSRQKASLLNCKVNKITIKDTKSRWGSCSTRNNINYNWRVILAPKTVIDYLISHEVAHLKHPDHSRNFWNCVRSLCPDCAQGRLWLRRHGKELFKYL